MNDQPHTCPYCELRFGYHEEIKGHILHDHPEHADVAVTFEVHELPARVKGRRSMTSSATIPADKVQGHWLLARLGKKILRPGGRQLTEKMLASLDVGPTDRVVELAPGMGATARALLDRHPASYVAVDLDADAAATTTAVVEPFGGRVVVGPAQHVPLPDDDATVVVGEAMLTMQSDANKALVVAEAGRLLGADGRYAIHELCLVPDDIDDVLASEIWADLSRTIHVGARPLTAAAWRGLLEAHGFAVIAEHRAPMALLSPRRIVADEGIWRATRFVVRLAGDRAARRRVRQMRDCFTRWSDHLAAVAVVAQHAPNGRGPTPSEATSP